MYQIEIINTGAEIMMGFTLNTHHQWLAMKLLDLGYTIARQVSVPDEGKAIRSAVAEAMDRSDLVIVTGGLGPTSDDKTRDEISELLNRQLIYSQEVESHIRSCFSIRKRPMPESVLIQAWAPEDSEIIMNHHGTAPGLWIDTLVNEKSTSLVLLPGPPRELYPMFVDQVTPMILAKLPLQSGAKLHLFNVVGLGESQIQERLEKGSLKPWIDQGLDLGYCAGRGEVTVRLMATGGNADDIVDSASAEVRQKLGHNIFSESGESLESVVIQRLRSMNATLTVAESCTGGFLGHRLTNVPGASNVFWGGFLVYSNEAKSKLVGVAPKTLEQFGAVSRETAIELAQGAKTAANTDYAISITGIAGPGGGSPEKPVGLVYIGLATPDGVSVLERINTYDRETFKLITTQQALDLLRSSISK